jgi:hypothetical protein
MCAEETIAISFEKCVQTIQSDKNDANKGTPSICPYLPIRKCTHFLLPPGTKPSMKPNETAGAKWYATVCNSTLVNQGKYVYNNALNY